jgi:uncharacterized protein GlcG (DUF336 family)
MRTIRTLGLSEAMQILDFLLETATADGLKPVAICVVDASGVQLCAATMDGTKSPSIKTAHDKAVTAVNFQRNTIEFCYVEQDGTWVPADDVVGGDGWSQTDIAAAAKINDIFVPWGGGALILSPHDGSILGAVGVSNRTEQEDHELASARPSGWTA